MSPTTHALVGAVLGRLAKRTDRAFLAGVASHALLDCLPHRDSSHPLMLLVDACGVLGVAALAAASPDARMLAGVAGGVLPDLENLSTLSEDDSDKGLKIFPSHWFHHHHKRHRRGLEIGLELLVVAAALLELSALGSTGSTPPSQRTADVIK